MTGCCDDMRAPFEWDGAPLGAVAEFLPPYAIALKRSGASQTTLDGSPFRIPRPPRA